MKEYMLEVETHLIGSDHSNQCSFSVFMTCPVHKISGRSKKSDFLG